MSEQNILNPAATSLLNFDYGYTEGLPEMRTLFQAMSGKLYSRRQMGRGRVYELAWNNRDLATKHALQQWAQQYENDFFTLADWERVRYFTGRFEGPLAFSPAGNLNYNIKGRFLELPGLAMFQYPSNWARDAIFLEERNGFGEDNLKLTGGADWVYGADPNAHGGAHYTNNNSNTADTAEWAYFGYGFRLWSETAATRGILSLSATRVRDGSVVLAATDVDLYTAATVPAAPVFTLANLGLDFYRVKITTTNRKNVSSSSLVITADAIEVMQ